MEEEPAGRLEAALRELRERLCDGQRRVEDALLELGACATSPHFAATQPAQIPQEPKAGGGLGAQLRQASGSKASASGVPDASQPSRSVAGGVPDASQPCRSVRSGHMMEYTLTTSTDNAQRTPNSQECQEASIEEEFATAGRAPPDAAASPAPRRDSLGSNSVSVSPGGFAGGSPRGSARMRAIRSWFQTSRSRAVSENTRCSAGEATSAMDMIGHDAVRSYDLRRVWRNMLYSDMTGKGSGTTTLSRGLTRLLSVVVSDGKTSPSRLRQRAQDLVKSAVYELSVLLLILSNSVFLGWQVQHEAKNREELPWNLHIEAFFCVVFLLELALKAYAMGLNFALGKERSWNLFDMTVVLLMVVDFVSTVTKKAESGMWSQVSSLRIFRAVRVIRFLRAVRVLKFFTQLRIMLRSIMFSVRPLLWASLVLAAMFYVFGICLTQGVVDYMNDSHSWDDPSMDSLFQYFGSLERSALSLFEAMSGGVNWGDLYDALMPLGLQFRCVFLFFVLFAIFGAANVVTGIFVEIANHWSRFDTHTQLQAEMEQKVFYIRALQDLFNDLDTDGSGTLTLESMQDAIQDDRLVNSFHALHLDLMDVRTLFLLLDRDRKGYIDIEEFLLGCFRLKGEAKTLDVMKLQYQCEWIMHNVVKLQDGMNISGVAVRPSSASSNASEPGELPKVGTRRSLFRSLSMADRREQFQELVGQQSCPSGGFSFRSGASI